MQEEIENKTVNLAVRTGQLSAKTFYKALRAYLAHRKQKNTVKASKDTKVKGKQTVKQLIGQGDAVKTIDVNDTGLKDFKRIANKYGLDFAVVKNRDPETERYTVFFKARDDDAITKTMQDYAKRYKAKDHGKDKDRTEKKPSVIKKLKELKEKIASMPRKQKEKRKEYER